MGEILTGSLVNADKPGSKKGLNVFLIVIIFILLIITFFFIFQKNLESFEKSIAVGDMESIESLPVFEVVGVSDSLIEDKAVVKSNSSNSSVFLSERKALIYNVGYLSMDGESWEEVNFSGDNYTNWIAEDVSFDLTKDYEYVAFFSCTKKLFSWSCPSDWEVVRMNKTQIDPLVDAKVDERKRKRQELIDKYRNDFEELNYDDGLISDETSSSSGGGSSGSSSDSSDDSSEDDVVEESFVGPYVLSTDYGFVNVTASDYDDTYNLTPDKVLDNNLSDFSRWSALGEQWIKFSFEEEKMFEAVNIVFYRGDLRRTNFSVQISTDDVNWQNVFSGQSSGVDSGFENFSFASVNLTYLRLTGYGNDGVDNGGWNSIIEIDFDVLADCVDGEVRTVSCDSSDSAALISERNQTCQDTFWVNDSCEIISCQSGYVLEEGSCVLDAGNYTDLLCPTGYYEGGSECESLAFPTAMGYGRYTTGGRGGQVVKVTTLDGDIYTEGSLRYALEFLSGPRIVVFDVAGEIDVSSALKIENGDITIVGQTAPGEGITIRGAGVDILDDNVIIRHIRIRPGDDYTYSSAPDAINVIGYSGNDISDMIFDHMSLSWGLDEVFSIWPRSATQGNITLQNSLLYEGLRYSKHEQGGSHSRGILIGTDAERVSVLNNLLAHNRRRNPMVNPGTSDIDFVNNLIYNWGEFKLGAAMQIYLPLVRVNILNNYYKAGPDTTHGSGGCSIPYAYLSDDCNEPLYGRGSYYEFPGQGDATIVNNVFDDGSGPEDGRTSSPCFNEPECAAKYFEDSPNFDLRDTPLRQLEGVTDMLSGLDVYDVVLSNSGATVPFRDSIDARIVSEVQGGTGGIIDSPNPLPARALPFATLGTNFFTGLGDMSDGYNWSGSNSESFTVNGYNVNLDQDCTNQGTSEANVQCILDMINEDLPVDIIAYNPTNHTNLYRVGIKTADVGATENLTVIGNAVFDRFWISEGIYYGFDGVQNIDGSIGYSSIENGTPSLDSDDDGMPDYWEDKHCLNSSVEDDSSYDLSAIYTNIEVYFADIAGDFGSELESQC